MTKIIAFCLRQFCVELCFCHLSCIFSHNIRYCFFTETWMEMGTPPSVEVLRGDASLWGHRHCHGTLAPKHAAPSSSALTQRTTGTHISTLHCVYSVITGRFQQPFSCRESFPSFPLSSLSSHYQPTQACWLQAQTEAVPELRRVQCQQYQANSAGVVPLQNHRIPSEMHFQSVLPLQRVSVSKKQREWKREKRTTVDQVQRAGFITLHWA